MSQLTFFPYATGWFRYLVRGGLTVLACLPSAVWAQGGEDHFKISFSGIDPHIQVDGDLSENNKAAVRNIARILSRWQNNRRARFFFVAPPFAECERTPNCDPEFLLWQRSNNIVAQARAEAIRMGKRLKFKTLDAVFVSQKEEFAPKKKGGGVDVLQMRVLPEDNIRPDNSCPWLVRIRDPSLPGSSARTPPFIPINANSQLSVSHDTRLQVLDHGLRRGRFFAFWENSRGQFRLAGDGLTRGNIVVVPQRSSTLHLMAVSRPAKKLSHFLDQLGREYRTLSRPKVLKVRNKLTMGVARGAGDHVRKVTLSSKRLVWPKTSRIQYCGFKLNLES